MPGDHLTFLSSPATVATKTITPTGAIPYAAGSGPFTVHRIPVDGLAAAAEVLQRCPPNAFAVRGRADATEIPYRRHRPRDGEPPTLAPEAHRLLPVDCDFPGEAPRVDTAAMAADARALLPAGLRTASAFAIATSSAGVKPGIRVRLWFWCSREVSDTDAKAWLRDAGADAAIYTPSQPIYCAAPRFEGVQDPIPARYAWLQGDAEAVVPDSFDRPAPTPGGFLEAFARASVEGQVGTRNTTLTSLAGTMRKRGASPAVIAAALEARNAEFPEPLPASEVEAIARSVSTYAPEEVVPPSKAATRAVDRTRKRARTLVEEDPALLPRAAGLLARHVHSGALTERQALRTLQEGLEASDVATRHAPEELARLLSTAPVEATTVETWATAAILDEDGNPVPCPENMRVVLSHHPDFALWFNSRAQQDWWARCPWRDAPGPVTGADDFALRAWLSKNLGWHRAPADPLAAIADAAAKCTWDPWRGYLDGLQWDGTCRLSTAAPRLLGCEDTPAHRHMFAWWLISAVARTMQPGCQVDHVLILEGEQGTRKSTFLRELSMDDAFFTRLVSGADLSSPRTIGKIHGPVIVEMAELAVLRRAEIEAIKAFVDERVDRVQWLYARKPVDIPRSCVFAATTNDREYFRDVTGNRRFWPIACGTVDVDATVAERDMLWAEAVALYHAGATWWPEEEDVERLQLRELQAERAEVEIHADAVDAALAERHAPGRHGLSGTAIEADMLDAAGRVVRATLAQVCALSGLPTRESRSVGRHLRLLGWSPLRPRGGKSRVRRWTAPDADNRGAYAPTKEVN